ncbi:MAG TPA: ABC transporter substrate-binding protein [Acidimicrobiales bacterium]|nr:ABC transporter substrate-binding protein [Acidimicrobiales bacterium]
MRKVAVAVALLALLAGACATDDDTAEEGSAPATTARPATVLIAVGGPFSGEAKALGDQIRAGAKLAADQVNRAGGIAAGPLKGLPVELDDSFDDANVPERAVENMLRAVDDARYVAFVGSASSDASVGAARVASEAGLSDLVAFATSPEVLKAARAQKSVFVVPPSGAASALAVAQELLKTARRRPAVIHVAGADGEGLAELVGQRLTDGGAPAVAVESFGPDDSDFSLPLGRIRAADPDSLLMIGAARSQALVLRQAEQLGLGVAAFDASGVAHREAFLRQAGNLANGLVTVGLADAQRDTPAALALQQAYRAATGAPSVPEAAAFAYEAVHAVAAGFADGASDRLGLSDHIHRISLPDTGVGPLGFSPDGSRIGGRLVVFTVVNGTPVPRTGYEQTGPAAVQEVALER